MSDIKGLVIQSRLDYLENHDDQRLWKTVLQKLSEPTRQAVGEQVFLTNLYPFRILKELDTVLGENLDQPLEKVFRDIGEHFAVTILDRYFYNYIEMQDPQAFLAQIRNLYPYLWNFGQYFYQKSDNHSASVRFEYDEDIHKPYCWFTQAFLKKGIEICGGKAVALQEETCGAEDGEACSYVLTWK